MSPTAISLPGTGTIVALLAGAAVIVALLAVLMRRRPEALPLLTVLALPFRVPISTDARTVNLLVPLYLVVAAGTLAHLLPSLLSGRQPRGAALDVWGRRLGWLLLASVLVYAIQSAYSVDHLKALENVLFFYLPFGLLFVLLREVEWTPQLLLRCLGVAVALAVLFAAVGFVEYDRKSLFLNPKVVAANQYDNYFRVNSVFFDPSIYGRFLALVMIAVSAVVLWSRGRAVRAGGVVLAWLLAGLVTSFSQSSIAALLLGLAVLAAMRWQVRATLYASGGVLAVALAILLLAPSSLHFGLKGSGGSVGNASSGRGSLIEAGLELFAERPLQGYGSGSFEKQYKRHAGKSKATSENAVSASHTIPVTVAAEQGLIGLALYAALLVCAFATLFRGARASPARVALAACFAGLVLHTWTYADFLEDPFTWALLGIGAALARSAGSPVPEEASPERPASNAARGARPEAASSV